MSLQPKRDKWHLDLCQARVGQCTRWTKVQIGLIFETSQLHKLYSSCTIGKVFLSHKMTVLDTWWVSHQKRIQENLMLHKIQ